MIRTDAVADMWRFYFPWRFGMDRETLAKMAMIPDLETETFGDLNAHGASAVRSMYERDVEKLKEHIFSLVNDSAESARVMSNQVLEIQRRSDAQQGQIESLTNKLAQAEKLAETTKLKLDIEIERYNDLIDKVLKQGERY